MNTLLDQQGSGISQALGAVYATLARYCGMQPDSSTASGEDAPYAPLAQLVESFGLSRFERDLLLLCAGVEIDSRFAGALASLPPNMAPQGRPSFCLALACLDDPHLSAISPSSALRSWQLIEAVSGDSLLNSGLRIDSRILLHLLAIPATDDLLNPLIRPTMRPAGSPMRLTQAMELGVRYWLDWLGNLRQNDLPKPLLLIAKSEPLRLAMAQEIAQACGLGLALLRTSEIPPNPTERDRMARRWVREAVLSASALYIESGNAERGDELESLIAFCERLSMPFAVGIREESTLEHLPGLRIPQPAVSIEERRALWSESLGPLALHMNGRFERIVEQFDLPPAEIAFAGALANLTSGTANGNGNGSADSGTDTGEMTWQICRQRSRHSLDQLARRTPTRAKWDDLILPDAQKQTLRQIIAHVRERALVYRQWGFDEHSSRGLAVSALFSGVSGTGKTMAAEVIAGALDLDLFHVDLSTIVSKYIGETEKNLRRIFDAAEESCAVLLFDEADALFGKRSEVRDSHDRYANLEVSYLLQRMEAYQGVAILTTNMKQAIDPAFVRRIRFIVQFQFPDAGQRAVIWQRMFPARAPLAHLDYARLAQLNVPGGVIRNIALQAAFLAAGEGQSIGMKHILEGARSEYGKLERSLTPAEIRGWP
jgi:ATPase family associated with various cellular activities (AAA)